MPQVQYQILAEPILPPSPPVPALNGWMPSSPDVLFVRKGLGPALADAFSFGSILPIGPPAVADPGFFMAQTLVTYPLLFQYQGMAEPVLPIPTPAGAFLWQSLTSDYAPTRLPYRILDPGMSVEPIKPIPTPSGPFLWMQNTQDYLPTRSLTPTAQTLYVSPFYPIPPNPPPPPANTLKQVTNTTVAGTLAGIVDTTIGV